MSDRDGSGKLVAGHSIRPVHRGGETEAVLIRRHLEPRKVEVLNKLGELAAAGDGKSMQIFLAYFSPGARPEDERVDVPGFASAPTLERKSAAVMLAIASGEVSAAAGQRLLAALETHTRIVTAGEIESRLAALERNGAANRSKPLIDSATGTIIDDGEIA
jgi:hypothetical protein